MRVSISGVEVNYVVGLGKTIQTIGLFSLLKQRAEVKKPHLIIVPATGIYVPSYHTNPLQHLKTGSVNLLSAVHPSLSTCIMGPQKNVRL